MDQQGLARFVALAKANRPLKGIDDRNVLDNRTDGENLGIHAFSSYDLLPEYYALKFRYFSQKLKDLSLAEGDPSESAEEGAWQHDDPELYAIWDQVFADECKAYLLRIAQCPKEAVIEAWYNDVEEFVEWAGLLERVDSHMLAEALGSEFPVHVETERSNPSRFLQVRADLERHLGSEMAASSMIGGMRTAHVEKVLGRLAIAVNQILVDPEGEFETGLRELVRVIATSFGVRICDLLQVTHYHGSVRLEVIASSSDQDFQQVRSDEQAYEAAQGITGSALLLSREEPYRWVGTGDLSLDPRAGLKHKDAWEHVYGRVDSFWVFPLFGVEGIEGALRVIDVEPGGYVSSLDAVSPWSFLVRAELACVADWFCGARALLHTALEGGREESVVTAIARSRRGASLVDGSGSDGLLPWVPLRYLGALLEGLSRLALMRAEHRTVGCMVAVGGPEAVADFVKDVRPYTSIPLAKRSGRLHDAAELFGRVLPGAGVFVCEVRGQDAVDAGDVMYSNVVATAALEPEAVIKQYGAIPDLAFIVVDGDRDMIRVYEEGAAVADYFLNEKSGMWQLREFARSERELVEVFGSHCSRPLLQAALRHIVDFSYEGSGGLIVLADGSVDKRVISRDGFQIEQLLVGMDRRLFASVASVDGGTWIDSSTGRVRQAGILFLNDSDEDEVQSGGARHKAAKYLWRHLTDAVIFAVSANRTITGYCAGVTAPDGSVLTSEFSI